MTWHRGTTSGGGHANRLGRHDRSLAVELVDCRWARWAREELAESTKSATSASSTSNYLSASPRPVSANDTKRHQVGTTTEGGSFASCHEPSDSLRGNSWWSRHWPSAATTARNELPASQHQPDSPPRYNCPHRGGGRQHLSGRQDLPAKPKLWPTDSDLPGSKPKPRTRRRPQGQ